MSPFWQGKRVFVTSATSFLGTWTSLALKEMGAQVFGFAESPVTSPHLFEISNLAESIAMTYGDLRDSQSLKNALDFAQADVVLHLGESGLLSEADKNSSETFSKAVMGTATLMELMRETASVRAIVVVSSDKVYQRKNDQSAFIESDMTSAEQGIAPAAKLCAEMVALSYRKTFFAPQKYNKHKIAIATARTEPAIGGGDFSPTSLVHQVMRHILLAAPLEIRHPHSVRPWIHVYDQVRGILLLAQGLFDKGPKLAATYNLGGREYKSIEEALVPLIALKTDSDEEVSYSNHGRLDSSQAETDLGFKPQWTTQAAMVEIAEWYKDYYTKSFSPAKLQATIKKNFL
ncbi:MAG: NAD-dependent epimerase/dehydratase family protein [Bdellovibrio sp.]|nr:NAD-dependent epimerase/dehydratase family protein [Bdellovibrio sp.]